MLQETFIYENELIICERASHYCILDLNLLQTLQIDFSHLFADSFVFGAFGMLQVPQKVIFFCTKAPTHLPIINILLNEE